MSPNVAAFLKMLSRSELGALAPGLDPYRACYLKRYWIVDLSTHPAESGEWMGEVITQGKYAGKMSTAAGCYQINHPTWARLCMRLGVRSFLHNTQDDLAVELLKECGAFGAINAGDIQTAIFNCSRTWASLPFSDAGQHVQQYGFLVQTYRDAGGEVFA